MLTFGIVVTILAGIVTYMHTVDDFGAPPSIEELGRYAASKQLNNGRFVNPGGVDVQMDLTKGMQALREMLTSEDTRPNVPLPTGFDAEMDTVPLAEGEFAVTWFGHSAVLLELDGRRLLIDPMLGPAASPVPMFFGKRFALEQPIDLDRIPAVDAVLISHDHYDHLDKYSIIALASRVGHFYVPLGVAGHLRLWGVPAEKITEMDWWDEAEVKGLRIAATPAQHFSGRGMTDRNRTLWASWVIKGGGASIYFSGDSGYGKHFARIGERYGPFDFTMMECGQYNEKWKPIHCLPEESVQAHLDLRGGLMMPIHWGAFTLAPHRWTEPMERVRTAAADRGVQLALPMIGQRFIPSRSVPFWDPAQ